MGIQRVEKRDSYAEYVVGGEKGNEISFEKTYSNGVVRIDDVEYTSEGELFEMMNRMIEELRDTSVYILFAAGRFEEELVESMERYGFTVKKLNGDETCYYMELLI